jgi:hypothetical protein
MYPLSIDESESSYKLDYLKLSYFYNNFVRMLIQCDQTTSHNNLYRLV